MPSSCSKPLQRHAGLRMPKERLLIWSYIWINSNNFAKAIITPSFGWRPRFLKYALPIKIIKILDMLREYNEDLLCRCLQDLWVWKLAMNFSERKYLDAIKTSYQTWKNKVEAWNYASFLITWILWKDASSENKKKKKALYWLPLAKRTKG